MIKAKRFWQDVSVREEDGFTIWLDDRELKTPNKNTLKLPTCALAEAVGKEWEAVEGEIIPDSMPLTKMANSALERIPAQREDVESHLLQYLGGDLLVYRAAEPEALKERQADWDAPLEWVREYGIFLETSFSLVGFDPSKESVEAAKRYISQLTNYELVSFHEYATITGSFVLAMAVIESHMDASEAFNLSRLDDDFQAETWGMVDVKAEERACKKEEILRAEEFQSYLKMQ